MKKVLSLMAGVVFILAFGMAYAEDLDPGSIDTGDRVIRDDDLERYYFDQGKGTFNVMPAPAEETGSAPGGIGGPDPDRDTVEKPAPIEKEMIKPADDDPYRD